MPTPHPPITALTGQLDSVSSLEEVSDSGTHLGHFRPFSKGGESRKVVILGCPENFQPQAVFQVDGGVQRSTIASCNTLEMSLSTHQISLTCLEPRTCETPSNVVDRSLISALSSLSSRRSWSCSATISADCLPSKSVAATCRADRWDSADLFVSLSENDNKGVAAR